MKQLVPPVRNFLILILLFAGPSAFARAKFCEVTVQGEATEAFVSVEFAQNGEWHVIRAAPHGPLMAHWHSDNVSSMTAKTNVDYRANDRYETYHIDSSINLDGSVFFSAVSSVHAKDAGGPEHKRTFHFSCNNTQNNRHFHYYYYRRGYW